MAGGNNNSKIGYGVLIAVFLGLLTFLAWAPRQNAKMLSEQRSEITELKTSQGYIEKELGEIKESVKSIDEKVDKLLTGDY